MIFMKNYQKLLIFALIFLLFAGCGFLKRETAPARPPNNVRTINPATPAESVREFSEAVRWKDYEAVKKLLSRATVAELEKTSSVKAFVDNAREFNRGAPETRNERIDGNTATIEVKDPAYEREEKWTTLKFIREDGIWKITRSGN